MSDFKNLDNYQSINYESALLVDEVSENITYIGTSENGKDKASATWRIKKIWKTGTVWNFGFPNGDQGFKFIWNERSGKTYE